MCIGLLLNMCLFVCECARLLVILMFVVLLRGVAFVRLCVGFVVVFVRLLIVCWGVWLCAFGCVCWCVCFLSE